MHGRCHIAVLPDQTCPSGCELIGDQGCTLRGGWSCACWDVSGVKVTSVGDIAGISGELGPVSLPV